MRLRYSPASERILLGIQSRTFLILWFQHRCSFPSGWSSPRADHIPRCPSAIVSLPSLSPRFVRFLRTPLQDSLLSRYPLSQARNIFLPFVSAPIITRSAALSFSSPAFT